MTNIHGLNCVICGVGGQGNVLASRLIAQALLMRGEAVKTAETIGMAQRGGSVVSHVRGGNPHSPLVPKANADCLIAFEPGEAVRNIEFLKPNGIVVTNTQATQPPTAALEGINYDGSDALNYLRGCNDLRIVEINGDAVCAAVGSSKVLNIVLLAAAVKANALGITRVELEDAIRARVKPLFHDMNIRAVDLVFNGQ